MDVGNNLPALIGAQLRGVRRHLSRAPGDDMKDPPGWKLQKAVGSIRGRTRYLAGDRSVPFAQFAVTGQAVDLVERLAFCQRLRICGMRIPQFATGPRGFILARPVMNGLVASGNRAGHWTLQGEAVPRDRVWGKGFVSRVAHHVRHVLESASLRVCSASCCREDDCGRTHHADFLLHNLAALSSIWSAPFS